MKKVFNDCRVLDKKARERYLLTEEIMMENAAAALEAEIRAKEGIKSVVILCGVGDNGSDGMTLARRIASDYKVTVLKSRQFRSTVGKRQEKRAKACKIEITSYLKMQKSNAIEEADCIVDCIFGAGFHGEVPAEYKAVLLRANESKAFKIACDIPTGIDCTGKRGKIVFRADVTVTMGAYKASLFSDEASDLTGEIKCASLGLSSALYEYKVVPDGYVLEESDMTLPVREKHCVHKGNFGHTAVFAGEKKGAAVIAASAASAFGSGLVTVVSDKELEGVPFDLMQSNSAAENTSAIAAGMGFGEDSEREKELFEYLFNHKEIKAVLDADLLHTEELIDFLDRLESDESESKKRIVLTPHPKEFASLLKNAKIKETGERVQDVKAFCEKYKKAVLVLKGAISIIATFDEKNVAVYYNPHGRNCLAKGGSGDVLSGLIAALLAQGYDTIQGVISAVLAHSFASQKITTSYGMTPFMLIDEVRNLA